MPAQMVVCVDVIETAGETLELTVITSALLVAERGDAHAELDVITQVTLAALVKVVEVKVAAFVPAFVPFIFH